MSNDVQAEIADEEILALLKNGILSRLQDPKDLATFVVRKGVTYLDFEAWIGNRLRALQAGKIRRLLQSGQFDRYLDGLIRDWKRITPFDEQPVYGDKDVQREVYAALRTLGIQVLGESSMSDIEEEILNDFLQLYGVGKPTTPSHARFLTITLQHKLRTRIAETTKARKEKK